MTGVDEDRKKTFRNIGIIVLLALAVWRLPQGALAGRTISNLLTIILLAGLAFFAYRMYMENRTALFDLPERLRMILYGSVALMIITLVATSRMWNNGGALVLLWFALIGIAVYGFATVLRAYREY
jgi:hypothetical protein